MKKHLATQLRMKISNQTCVVISCYPENHLDNSLLGITIESWKQQGYDICLVSHAPVSQELQREVKYYIYTDENEMLTFPDVSNTTWFHNDSELAYYTNWGNQMGKHSYAILENLKNAFNFLKIKKYSHFICIDGDGFFTQENHDLLNEKLIEADFLNIDYWLMMEYSEMANLPVSNLFGGRIDYFNKRLQQIKSHEDYFETSKINGGYSLEAFFGALFILNPQGKGYIEPHKPRDLFKNEWFGASSFGEVFVPGLKYKNWWLDLVKDLHTEEIIYVIVSHATHNFDTKLKVYRDGIEIVEWDFTTGPLAWFKVAVEGGKQFRLEQTLNGKVVRELEYSIDEVLNNGWSFLKFH